MNSTTVKRGIGAVILALIAAALLALLLNNKAAQRQEVVETAIPGTGGSSETSNQSTRLPTLTTDNSGNGDVIANAGEGSGTASENTGTVNSSKNSDGTVIASVAATGAAVTGAAASAINTKADSAKKVDFSVKPTASKASGEFLDLVNNGDSPAATKPEVSKDTKTTSAAAQVITTSNTSSSDQGVVIASTSPKSAPVKVNAVKPRLIDEKKSAPVKSARTAKVITKKAPAEKSNKTSTSTKPAMSTNMGSQAKNGYAIQLLATSSQSRANNLKNVMAGEGYPTYVTKTNQNGKTLYRVRIGQYTLKSAAIKAQSAMKRRYKKNTNVTRSAVVAR